MKVELDPTGFSKFYKNLEEAVALKELIGSGWQREIKRHRHVTYDDWSESYDWTITYMSPSARIDLSVTERYINADFIQQLKPQGVTKTQLLERLSKNALLWRVPLGYSVDITIEGKDADEIEKEVKKLL